MPAETQARHEQLRAAFEAVVLLPPEDREAALDVLALAPAQRAHVLRLIHVSDAHTSRATRLARRLDGVLQGMAGPEVGVGDTLGAWKLVAELGRGGMGVVYLAERDDGHFHQRAALKVLQGLPSAEALELLGRERQILASLSHPHIARLLDGGATPRGRPYLVMEHVEGVPLDAYVDGRSAHAIVRLLVQVCAAVSFAHARLIVHCDLKPSNVLVGAGGRPVLLDFGIARLLDPALAAGTAQETSATAFTPRYASPELRRGETIGTATDVYALGVLLRELLGDAMDADLAAITAKASRTHAGERYAAVSLLALDLERWLEGRTVSARTQTWRYRSGKLLRRRWPLFAVGLMFLLTIALFMQRVARERDRAVAAESQARHEATTAGAVSQFLQELFLGADPDAGGTRNVPALTLVERGRERVETELAGQPATQADLLGVLARVYANLGAPERAESSVRRALAIERALPRPRPARMVALLSEHAHLLVARNRSAEAEAPAAEALALAQTLETTEPRQLLVALAASTEVQSALMKFDVADAMLARTLAARERLGDRGDVLADTWYNIGQNAQQRGDNARALKEFQRTAAALERRLGSRHPRTLTARQAIAVSMGRQERLAEAEILLREVVNARLDVHGARSSALSSAQAELAYVLTQKGAYIEAAKYNEEVLAHDAAVEGEQSPVYARTLNNLAFAYQNMGDAERCVAAFQRSLQIREATLPAGDLAIARAQNNLARFLMWLGRTDEARPLVEAALATRSAALPPEHEERVESLVSATEWARRQNDLAGARRHWAQIEPQLAKVHPYTRLEAQRTLAWLTVSEGGADARQRIADYIDGLRAALGANHPSILRGRVAEMEMLQALGAHTEAVALARDLAKAFRALPDAYPPQSVFHARVAAVTGG